MSKKNVSKVCVFVGMISLVLSGCGSNNAQTDYSNDERYGIYQMALAQGYDGTYEDWLASIKGQDGHTPVITIGENGNWFIDGTDTGVKATGEDGKSAYELYCESHPEYTKTEQEWLDDLINGRLGDREKHTVTFYVGDEVFATQQVQHSYLVQRLENEPLELGKIFDGWFSEDDEKWMFDRYAVYGDISLYAHYTNELFEYELVKDKAYITKYNGGESVVNIPVSSGGYDVIGIGERAFKDCLANEIHLTDKIESIGFCAFENCTNIAEITIPASVISMGNTAFIGCSALEKVVYNSNAFPSNGSLFKGSSIKTVEFNGTSVPAKACYSCTNLTNIVLGENTTSLGNYCFYGCTGVTSIKLPQKITYTGFYSFHSSGLTTIDLHEGITSVDNSFRECPFAYIVLPLSLTSITGQAFYCCPSSMKTYYRGNSTQWEQVSVSVESSVIKNHVFFYSEAEPTGIGSYWHYVDGAPAEW